jgi:hypothetical protein
MAVRGKFKLKEITQVSYNPDARIVKFEAVGGGTVKDMQAETENAIFHRFTPTGAIEMTVDNPAASNQFEIGKEYYVDFTPA